MYNADDIKADFIELIGWRQNDDIANWQITDGAPILNSETGLYYNSVHPLLTPENLYSIAPDFTKIYPTQVERNDAFTKWLTQKTEDGILEAVNAWINQKNVFGTSRNLLDNDELFKTSGNLYETTPLLNNRFVGFELAPMRHKGLSIEIKTIDLQFNAPQQIEILLFKSGQSDPIQARNLNYNQTPGTTERFNINWTLPADGVYFIGYETTGLLVTPINGVRNYTYKDAGLTYFPHNRYFTARGFSTAYDGFIWDLRKTVYTLDTNWGINLGFDVRCDYSEFLIDQRANFKNLIYYQVAINMLKEMAFNPNSRVNRHEANMTREQVLYEIDGDTRGRNDETLAAKKDKALAGLMFDTKQIQSVCLPCRRRGVKFKTIG